MKPSGCIIANGDAVPPPFPIFLSSKRMSIGSSPEIEDQPMEEELQRSGSLLMLVLVGSREVRKQEPPVDPGKCIPKT
jgi:hypothetical protein